jgi:hypothetical protein
MDKILLLIKLFTLCVKAVKAGKGELARQRLIKELQDKNDEETISNLKRLIDD